MKQFAQVVFPLPLEKEFTYKVPVDMEETVVPGSIVAAPFRNSLKTGFVTALSSQKPTFNVKELRDILFDEPVFDEEMFALARWMGSYYFVSTGKILDLMLPIRINRESYELITLGMAETPPDRVNLSTIEEKIVHCVRNQKRVTLQTIRKEIGRYHLYHSLDKLKKYNLITIHQQIASREVKPKTVLYYRPLITLSEKKKEELFSRAPLQKIVYTYICGHNPISRSIIVKKYSSADQAFSALIKKGLIEKFSKAVVREYLAPDEQKKDALPPLKKAQKLLVKQIVPSEDSDRNSVYLLHGVTGSGKTRVYMELIRKSLEAGQGVLLLVPEIALTDYFLTSFRAQFGNEVAVLHSRMSTGEQYDSWRSIASGQKRLVIGPRSVVFAPVKRLKLVIVDEEHDSSYKQHESPPYYHARDVAVYRGVLNNGVVILGSATPSLESYYNAINGKYTLLKLPDRIDNVPMPDVKLIDLKNQEEEEIYRKRSIFSDVLIDEIRKRLKKSEQVLLMHNRRGFSTFISCSNCGYIETCSQCNISLTFHKKTNKVVCHFCGNEWKAPLTCPECSGTNLRYTGVGTQQVEESLKEYIPGYQTIRMDLDTTRSKSAHKKITSEFERGDSDVLVGTQMIAKGFDFSRVNLVGIVSADTGLLLPEFRAAEKTFQLLTQAAGRAGRRKEQGLVLVQTYHSDHYCLNAVIKHDFIEFYEQESKKRKELDYPPFGRIILLRFSGQAESEVEKVATQVGKWLRKTEAHNHLLGPAPAPIRKARNKYRWMIFLRSGKSEDLNGRIIREAARMARDYFMKSSLKQTVSMTIDVDPVNLL